MADALFGSVGEFRGVWDPFSHPYRDEIIREEYFSKEFPVCMVLEKRGTFWISGVFLKDLRGWHLLRDGMYFGLDSYKQAHNSLSKFSETMMEEDGLADLILNSGWIRDEEYVVEGE